MSLINQLLQLILRRYWLITLAGLLLAAGGLAVAGFKVENSIESWVDHDNPRYHEYRQFLAEFGDDASLHAVFTRAALGQAVLADYQALVDELRGLPAVVDVFDPVALFLLDAEGQTLKTDATPAVRSGGPLDVLLSADGRTAGLLILLDQQQAEAHAAVVDRTRQGFEALDLPVRLAGTAYVSSTIAEALTRDITLVVSALTTIAALVLLICLRNVWVVASVFAGIVLSVILTLAFASLLGVQLNLLSLVLFPLIFCVGLTTAVHLFTRRIGDSWAFESAWRAILPPASLAMLTTLLGSCAFVFAPQQVVRDMGVVVPFGVAVTFVLTLLFVPAVFRVLNRSWVYQPPVARARQPRGARRRAAVAVLLLILAGASLLLLPRLQTEPDAIFFFPDDSELVRNYRSIEADLTGLLVVNLIAKTQTPVAVTGPAPRAALEKLVDATRDLPALTTVVSPLPLLQAGPALLDTMPRLRSAFVSDDGRAMRLDFRFRNLAEQGYHEDVAQLRQAWASSGPEGMTLTLTGLVPLILEAQEALLQTQALIFPLILALMTGILFLVMRSMRLLLFAVIANFLPLILVAGTMAVGGIAINSINLFVASVMLGVIVDDTIHLLYAWRRHGSMDLALSEVHAALWVTSLTMMLAFASLFLSSLAPIRQFGLLALVALGSAYACDVFLLPWLASRRQASA